MTPGQPVPALTHNAWQGSHWSAIFQVTGMTRLRKNPDSNPGSSALETYTLTTRPTRRYGRRRGIFSPAHTGFSTSSETRHTGAQTQPDKLLKYSFSTSFGTAVGGRGRHTGIYNRVRTEAHIFYLQRGRGSIFL